MKEDELKKIWKSSPDEELIRLEKSRLISNMQSDVDRWIKMLKNRDSYLLTGILFSTILLGIMAYTVPFILSKIGAILCLLSFIYWYIRYKQVKKLKPRSYSETFIDYLFKIRKYLKNEKKFSDQILYSLFLPVTLGAVLFRFGYFINTQESLLKIIGIIVISTIGYFIYIWTNAQITSRLQKVEDMIESMEE